MAGRAAVSQRPGSASHETAHGLASATAHLQLLQRQAFEIGVAFKLS